jgi:hypothetical protein
MHFLQTKHNKTACQNLQSFNVLVTFLAKTQKGSFVYLLISTAKLQIFRLHFAVRKATTFLTYFLQQQLVRILAKQTFLSTWYVLFSRRHEYGLLSSTPGWMKDGDNKVS